MVSLTTLHSWCTCRLWVNHCWVLLRQCRQDSPGYNYLWRRERSCNSERVHCQIQWRANSQRLVRFQVQDLLHKLSSKLQRIAKRYYSDHHWSMWWACSCHTQHSDWSGVHYYVGSFWLRDSCLHCRSVMVCDNIHTYDLCNWRRCYRDFGCSNSKVHFLWA